MFEYFAIKLNNNKMNNYCRLCAELKTDDELNTKISDSTLNIEEKLIACCQWNYYQHYVHLPNGICYLCYEKLEKFWLFSESVAFAQIKLLEIFHEIEVAPVKHESDMDDDDFNICETKSEEIFVEPIRPSTDTTQAVENPGKIFIKPLKPSNDAIIREEKPLVIASTCEPSDETESYRCITCEKRFFSADDLKVSAMFSCFYISVSEYLFIFYLHVGA